MFHGAFSNWTMYDSTRRSGRFNDSGQRWAGQALPGTTPPLLHSHQFHDFYTTPLQLLPQQLVNYSGRLVGVVNGNYLVLVQPLVDFIQVFILKVFDDGHAHFG